MEKKYLIDELAALKSAGDKLARYARSLRLSVTAHPNYTGEPNAEWTDLVEGVDEALAEWKGERKLTPEEIAQRKEAIEWYRSPARSTGAIWVKASEPGIKDGEYIAKFKPAGMNLKHDYVGMAFVEGGYIRFSCPDRYDITWAKGHEELQYLQLLDESAGEKEGKGK